MKTSIDEIVRATVARHLERSEEEITLDQELEADLGLDPLDLVLIGLRIEDREGLEFPMDDLEGASTVEDLADIVREMRCQTLEDRLVTRAESFPAYHRTRRVGGARRTAQTFRE